MISGIWITLVVLICTLCTPCYLNKDLSSNCRLAPPVYSVLRPKMRVNGPMGQHHTKLECRINATGLRIRLQKSLLIILYSKVCGD